MPHSRQACKSQPPGVQVGSATGPGIHRGALSVGSLALSAGQTDGSPLSRHTRKTATATLVGRVGQYCSKSNYCFILAREYSIIPMAIIGGGWYLIQMAHAWVAILAQGCPAPPAILAHLPASCPAGGMAGRGADAASRRWGDRVSLESWRTVRWTRWPALQYAVGRWA